MWGAQGADGPDVGRRRLIAKTRGVRHSSMPRKSRSDSMPQEVYMDGHGHRDSRPRLSHRPVRGDSAVELTVPGDARSAASARRSMRVDSLPQAVEFASNRPFPRRSAPGDSLPQAMEVDPNRPPPGSCLEAAQRCGRGNSLTVLECAGESGASAGLNSLYSDQL